MRAAVAARNPKAASRIVTIGNGFDRDDLAQARIRAAAPPEGAVKLIYAGRLLRYQSVGEFFRVFGRLADEAASAMSLDLLGYFHDEQLVAARAAIDADRLTVRDGVPHVEAIQAMAEADVLVTVTEGGGAGAGTMSGKLYEYMALRRPILLLGPEGSAAHLVRTSSAGAAADPKDGPAVEAAIREVCRMARDPGFSGASDAILASFERHNLAMQWHELLRHVISKTARP
jgi:hypothetical protein